MKGKSILPSFVIWCGTSPTARGSDGYSIVAEFKLICRLVHGDITTVWPNREASGRPLYGTH